jgi:hypothetical protein
MTGVRKHWIAWAPIGVSDWESPALIFDYEGAADRYRALGWTVEGPFEPARKAVQLSDIVGYIATLNDFYNWNRWIIDRLEERFGE